jgi:hypothetical protein
VLAGIAGMAEDKRTRPAVARKGLAILLLVAGGLLYWFLGGPDDNPIAMIGPVVMVFGIILHFRGRQHAAKSIAEGPDSPIRDAKPDVLYLRSFQDDASGPRKILLSGLTTEEEQLADVLRPFGDLIAIGQPGEPLPLPGAARIYASNAEWRSVVLERMRVARLVVIRAGTGPGLLWECEQVFSLLEPQRVLFLILNMTAEDYRLFADRVGERFRVTLPALGPGGLLRNVMEYRQASSVLPGFVSFSAGWNAAFHPLQFSPVRMGYNDLKKPFSLALRPIFEAHGIRWHLDGRFG